MREQTLNTEVPVAERDVCVNQLLCALTVSSSCCTSLCVCCVSYDVSCVVFILHKRVVQPDELLVLSNHRELVLLEVRQRALWKQNVRHPVRLI